MTKEDIQKQLEEVLANKTKMESVLYQLIGQEIMLKKMIAGFDKPKEINKKEETK